MYLHIDILVYTFKYLTVYSYIYKYKLYKFDYSCTFIQTHFMWFYLYTLLYIQAFNVKNTILCIAFLKEQQCVIVCFCVTMCVIVCHCKTYTNAHTNVLNLTYTSTKFEYGNIQKRKVFISIFFTHVNVCVFLFFQSFL